MSFIFKRLLFVALVISSCIFLLDVIFLLLHEYNVIEHFSKLSILVPIGLFMLCLSLFYFEKYQQEMIEETDYKETNMFFWYFVNALIAGVICIISGIVFSITEMKR
jgi:hypothetical protein